jgi:hypothetical protein
MQLTVTTIIFGLPTGQRTSYVCLTLPTTRLPVRELIACKIRQEVEECLIHQRPGLSGEYLTPEELLLAAGPAANVMPGTVADEIMRAQQAFAARAYMIVVDNRRIWKADEELTLHAKTQVEFIKILPLVGG